MPKTSSSSLRRGIMDQGSLHEDEFTEEVTTEHVQRADVLITHTVVSDTLHAELLNSVHSRAVAGYMDEMNKLIEKKVIAEDTGEDIILKNGQSAFSLYGDRTHEYSQSSGDAGLSGGKIVVHKYGDWGTHRNGQVCCLLLQTAKSGMKSELSKRSPLARRCRI